MSSARGSGFPRGRGRGSTQPGSRGRGRGASTTRGWVYNNVASPRGFSTARGRASLGQPARGTTGRAGRGTNNAPGNAFGQAAPTKASFGGANSGGNWQERYQGLTKGRDRERQHAIRQGLVADPEKPRALSEAITPVGTCQDMCAEYERVQRVVQDDVWAEEKAADGEPDESRMVKKFRRAAAGLEEQLPSDLRSPQVLKRTCDYLFDEIIGNAPSLAQVHHFVWDRTRAIRNDFSIQQLTKLEELRIAVECYERIARFHILSLHQLASPERPYAKYDWPQEREQLDRTLLSLVQYYEDTRGRVEFPNEAEFRAYCVIFQLRSPTPDLEDSVQAWPRPILRDRRVRKALEVYAAGCTIMRLQGPLNPKASHLIARQDWQRVWVLLESNEMSYLTACVAEIYFNSIRQTVLNAIFRTSRANTTLPTPDWTLDVLCELFAFDEGEEVQTFCQHFGFSFKEREDGETYLDLSSVSGKVLPLPNPEMPNQLKSSLVENKRLGRTLPAVINGMTVRQAQDTGLLVEDEHDEGMEDVKEGGDENLDQAYNRHQEEDDENSLFVPEDRANAIHFDDTRGPADGTGSEAKPSPFSWVKPSDAGASAFSTPTATPSAADASKPNFNFLSSFVGSEKTASSKKPSFNILNTASKPAEMALTGSSGFNFLSAGTKTSAPSTDSKSASTFPSALPVSHATTAPAPKFDFTGGFSKASESTSPTPASNDAAATANDQTAARPQQNGILSKPAQAQTSAPSPFQFAPSAAAKSTSADQSTAANGPFLRSSSAEGTSPTAAKPASVKSASPSPEGGQAPFLPPPKSPAQTQPESSPSFQGQSKQVQPHNSAPSSSHPPSLSSPSPSPSQLHAGIRRPSTSTDTKPKKPSPLSNSFTAADDSTTLARAPPTSFAAPKTRAPEKVLTKDAPQEQLNQLAKFQQVQLNALAETGELKKPTPYKRAPSPSEAIENFDATVTRVAKEIFEDDVNGYFKQYVEYKAGQFITSVQEEIASEKIKLRLGELRISTLYRKYFKKWAGLLWQKRLAKSGKERRERRRRRLENGFDDGSERSSIRSSRPGSVLGNSSWKDHQENVDARFQRTMNSRSLARLTPAEQPIQAGSKRPTSSHGDIGLASRASAHKRLKSTSHVDDRGRVTKLAPTSQPKDDILARSSFLGFSINGPSPSNENTTKSNYFKLKAMGVHRADELSAPRGTKRSRTESVQPLQTSPPQLRPSASTASSPDGSTKLLIPPTSATLSRAQKAKEEDDALLARIRAARESLTLGSAYMRSEVQKDEDFRRSLSTSQSSTESPSMLKARADARLRASQTGFVEDDIPAYRLRESKFVPREHYGRAIERSREMRASRSREMSRATSRPESRLGQSSDDPQSPGFSCTPALKAKENSQNSIPNGLPSAKLPSKQPSFEQRPTSFSSPERPAQPDFSSHHTEMPHSNPFLQSTVPESQQPAQPSQPFTPDFSPFYGAANKFGVSSQPISGGKPSFEAQSGFSGTFASGGQSPFSPQQPMPTFQSPFDSQPATGSNSFAPAVTSVLKHTSGNVQSSAPFAPPQDHTIHPSLIDQSLAISFGNHYEDEQQHADEPLAIHSVPPQHSSYMDTQTIPLPSNDQDEVDEAPADEVAQPQRNGFGNDDTEQEELLDEGTDEDVFVPPYGQANPFPVLSNQHSYKESASENQAAVDEMYDQHKFTEDEEQLGNGFDGQDNFSENSDTGFANQYYNDEEDEDAEKGNIDEESDLNQEGELDEDDGFDTDEEDEEGEDYESEEEEPPQQPWQAFQYTPRPPAAAKQAGNSALQGMGKTEDEPIELDSD